MLNENSIFNVDLMCIPTVLIVQDGRDSINDSTIQCISHGTLSLQHSDGETIHARHVSVSRRRHVGRILQSSPEQKIFINSLVYGIRQ